MIDTFTLVLSHGLLILTAWRLISRDDLDDDDAPPRFVRPFRFTRKDKTEGA